MPSADTPPVDRRQRVKRAHRRAIAEAAVALAQEFGPGQFSADQLAERADVARRTIFNHFSSIEEAIYAGLGQTLDAALDSFTRALESAPPRETAGHDGLPSLFDDLSDALLGVDLVPTLSQVVATIASPGVENPETSQWAGGVLSSIIPLLEAQAEARAAGSKRSGRALLIRSLIVACSVAFEEWYDETDGVDDAHSRLVWRRTLDESLHLLRAGFAAHPAG